ncbi:MAG: 4Fe-4S binding protein [Bdellovibrionales bacterium]|nr:4Fe-4S binding protein [Bdellovibrionales bacterium]
MLKTLKVRFSQGKQFVPDVTKADPKGFRGLPKIGPRACEAQCQKCAEVCPTHAINVKSMEIDLGRCIFCEECSRVCPVDKITYSNQYKMAASSRESLSVSAAAGQPVIEVSRRLKSIFGRSLRLRSVSTGGCNGCELELAAIANVNFDVSRFGFEFVASPRHADGLVITGPLTVNMREALELAYDGMPDPKFVIAVGACAISGGLYADSHALDRSFLNRFAPELYIPGCPPHPLTIANGLLDLLGRKG